MFFKVIIFLTAKVAANPIRYSFSSQEEYTRFLDGLSNNVLEFVEKLPRVMDYLKQINSLLEDLVPYASTDIVILCNILL
jgi:RNase adaptor protein for sRNA GlmZ degradation